MRLNKYIPVLITALFIVCTTGFAENKYPYVAQVIGENVNTRAGAGVNHYRCGRLSEPTNVIVKGEQFGFSEIKPPKGSFSWIAQKYVAKKDDATGEVTGNKVNVWVGSPYVSAIHSSSRQTTLDKGAVVKFAGKPEGDYYKILPPDDASLWINSSYLKYVGPLSKFMPKNDNEIPAEPKVAPKDAVDNAEETPEEPADAVADGEDIDLDKPLSEDIEQPAEEEAKPEEQPVQPKEPEVKVNTKEMEAIDAYLVLTEKVKEEKQKPLAVQDYTEIKTSLEAIIAEPENGRAVKFAQSLIDVVERYQAAQLADEAIRQQDSELVKLRSEIRKNLKKEMEEINATTGYVMIGTLAKSYVYTTESGDFRYAVKDDKDSIVAYAIPTSSDIKNKAEKLIGKKIGLNGEVEPDVNTSKVIVYFTDIKEIWEPKTEEK
ncbi:MAG: SH3 domain-containing protein [Sedimentisphaeraceae bacterium JB056]